MANDASYLFKPGLHSRNVARHAAKPPTPTKRRMTGLQWILLLIGLTCLGYYAYTWANERIYQAYENWAFDQQIAGRVRASFQDYLREHTPFGFLAVGHSETAVENASPLASSNQSRVPVEGEVIGRVAISRLNLSAVVRQGVNDATLKQAVGHVPSTALAGQPGNFAIAAHRDTLFRALKDIKTGDVVSFQSPAGTFDYRVIATKIVKPTDVSVLRPDGGGWLPQVRMPSAKILTMITCYPFYYVGSAPSRFIVQAQQVN